MSIDRCGFLQRTSMAAAGLGVRGRTPKLAAAEAVP
jgi:hypothetical protein